MTDDSRKEMIDIAESELTALPTIVAIELLAEAKAAGNIKPALLTAKQVGTKLGLSEREVRIRAQSGSIPPGDIRIGTARRWRDAVLDRWIEAGCPSFTQWRELGYPTDMDPREMLPT